ncbi:MAG: hypothetical protein EBS01_16140 [Verrucomicrobia bacterium]|nr:hypothetical protein [Verrucomicrobiota bacterium]
MVGEAEKSGKREILPLLSRDREVRFVGGEVLVFWGKRVVKIKGMLNDIARFFVPRCGEFKVWKMV